MTLTSFFQTILLSGKTRVYPNISWLVVLPLGVWSIATVYVPILGSSSSPVRTGIVTFLIIGLIVVSLMGHLLGHLAATQLLYSDFPERIPIFLFGDAAQIWPVSLSLWKEVLAAFAGPLVNFVVAGLAYLGWNAQWSVYLNLSMPFIGIFNLWLAVINLIPVYPLDGGRITNAVAFRLLGLDPTSPRLLMRLAYLAVMAEIGWGIFLIAQKARYSLETGIPTIFIAVLAAIGLMTRPADQRKSPVCVSSKVLSRWIGASITGLVFLALTAVSFSLLLTNDGVEAPGPALSVEPMVEIPAQYRHPPTGTFLLTSVIQQSPIPAGIWALGQLTPVYKILPPEKIAPNQPSPQESAQQGFRMLDQSETTAAVVGLRLAGFNAKEVGKGAEVASILPESPAKGVLMPGDIITELNGTPVHTATELINLVKTASPRSTVHLSILRDQHSQELTLSLMPPAATGGPPRIGIVIQDAGFDFSLPIPVKIVPQKIVGGPSAGLMFTLTLYNLLTPQDLTRGWRIAGTGTINPDGSVGPIGGVQQKVAAAEEAGAVYFLSPAENYADAASVATRIKVVKVTTVEEAIAFLRSLPIKK